MSTKDSQETAESRIGEGKRVSPKLGHMERAGKQAPGMRGLVLSVPRWPRGTDCLVDQGQVTAPMHVLLPILLWRSGPGAEKPNSSHASGSGQVSWHQEKRLQSRKTQLLPCIRVRTGKLASREVAPEQKNPTPPMQLSRNEQASWHQEKRPQSRKTQLLPCNFHGTNR
jgi:hypothetical protein